MTKREKNCSRLLSIIKWCKCRDDHV